MNIKCPKWVINNPGMFVTLAIVKSGKPPVFLFHNQYITYYGFPIFNNS
jgi:hypothetical protein